MRILLLCVGVYLASAVKLTDEVKDALVEKLFEDFKQREDHVADPRFCADTGLTCYECSECHDHLQYGQCIADGDKSRRCLCKWGWTGPNAQRVYVANEVSEWSRNRVRAANCKTPCHYTHDYWNPQCAAHSHCIEKYCNNKNGVCVNDKCVICDEKKCNAKYATCVNERCKPTCIEKLCNLKHGTCIKGECVPKCNEKQCRLKGGKCFAGVCKTKCCRGHSGPNAIYVGSEDTYYADDCNTPCPYLGTGIENPDCTKSPKYPEPCDPKCEISGGKCDYSTGRCKCCQDWTGPNPTFDKSTKTVHADFCDTYCPYFTYGNNYGKMNMLCVNDNYVRRCQTKINLVGRMNNMNYGG